MYTNPTYLTVISILVFLVVLSIYDENVPRYLWVRLKFLSLQIRIIPLLIWYHPNNPITRWRMERQYRKMAREMIAEVMKTRNVKEKVEEE